MKNNLKKEFANCFALIDLLSINLKDFKIEKETKRYSISQHRASVRRLRIELNKALMRLERGLNE